MLQNLKNLLFGLIGLFLLNGFRCGDPELFSEFSTFYLHSWQGKWLDNSGAQPILVNDAVNRGAFGFRLSAIMSQDGQDTLQAIPPSTDTTLITTIRSIQIFTPNGFDTVPPGADISGRFKLLFDPQDNSNKHYYSVANSPSLLNLPPPGWSTDYRADFIMTSPPMQTGLFECTVKITFDSTDIITKDTLFTLPAIFLQ